MISTDREILISIQGEIRALKVEQSEQGKRITRIEERLDHVESLQVETVKRLDVVQARFDMLLWCIGIGFALLAVMMGICTWIITAVPLLRSKHEQSPAQNLPANDTDPALIQSVIELMRYTRESEKH